jgi:ribosomal protein S20
MLGAGFEPPFTHPPVTDIERKDAALRKALSMIEVMKKIIHKGKATRGAAVIDAAVTSIKEALS